MRTFLSCVLVSVLGILASSPNASAADDNAMQVIAGLKPGGSYSEIDGFDYQQGYTLGFNYLPARRWGAEIKGAFEGYSYSDGEDTSAYSIDLAGHYYFADLKKWRVYAAGGVRFAENEFDAEAGEEDSAIGILVGLGSDYSFSRRLFLRLDASVIPMELSGDADRLEEVSFGFGLGFRF